MEGKHRTHKIKGELLSLIERLLQGKPIVTKELILRLCDPTPTMLPTTTARRYLVPTALVDSGQHIPAVAVTAVIVIVVVAAEGAATAFGPEVALAVAAAALLLLAVLLGGPEEPKGLSAHRLVVFRGESISSSEEESIPSEEGSSSSPLSDSS